MFSQYNKHWLHVRIHKHKIAVSMVRKGSRRALSLQLGGLGDVSFSPGQEVVWRSQPWRFDEKCFLSYDLYCNAKLNQAVCDCTCTWHVHLHMSEQLGRQCKQSNGVVERMELLVSARNPS